MNKANVYRPKIKATKHQKRGIADLLGNIKLNFDDQGLGKTKQAYDTAGTLLADNKINLSIFVTKAALIESTRKEIENDGHQFTVAVANGGQERRLGLYRTMPCNALVVSYETIISDTEILREIIRANRVALFFDESHYIKNSKAKRSCAALSLAEVSEFVFCLSGTPIPNKIEDIYTQLIATRTIVDISLQDFKDRYGTQEALAVLLEDKFIRRQKTGLTELNLPDKEVVAIKVRLSKAERLAYMGMEADFAAYLKNETLKSKIAPVTTVLVKMLRLNQLLSNPSLVFSGYSGRRSKFEAAVDIANKVIAKGEKVIIWTSFKQNVAELREALLIHNPLVLTGDSSACEKFKMAEKFQIDSTFKVIIAVPAAAREGFTLTAANHAIYLDRSYSSLDWLQSQDRIHRISQTRKCFIYRLEVEDSIDNLINDLLENKYQTMSDVLNDQHRFVAKQSDLSLISKFFGSRARTA